MIPLSVIICTHDPRPDYLARTLAAIRGQTLPPDQWDLLIVDNRSAEPLAGRLDLSWHPSARLVREDELGTRQARIRGLLESRGELVLFVDDDNVLASDYFEIALKIARERPYLGAWCGSARAEYAVPPPDSIRPYLEGCLALSAVEGETWSNLAHTGNRPFGAGLCLRRCVADAYLRNVARDPLRQSLGRTGRGQMQSGEDDDLTLSSLALGLGTGRFAALKFTHLIPAARLTEDYIVRTMAGIAWSGEILSVVYPPVPARATPGRCDALVKFWYFYLVSKPFARRILCETRRAQKAAHALIARVRRENPALYPDASRLKDRSPDSSSPSS